MNRLRKSSADDGFTLVELLVVIIIIGTLAAIAIPALISQRRKATDASLKSDLRTVATAIEAARTADGDLPTTKAEIAFDARTSPGNTFGVTVTGTHFCISGDHPAGQGASHAWVYDTANGGFQAGATATCTGSVTFVFP
ncbi:prepilin-type N-terminal cleavage/methylation domain-containing protein [Cellulomonas humilata]|uniref:Prepilin-type N-terminal cleavage/methylation domain-containing protein n=1 Tax=Cellulomonas humilata TaxID=144055 RepID=A0A7Y6A0Y8_9CELL|nr:prepilin-type N-terminal cleavage/methylation domain-containing protein [Cellulomonas humilata]NUU17652.1 prepilin-type N-terminal cleavage/methylation domain-containing protein [Cellulomonas humilata]